MSKTKKQSFELLIAAEAESTRTTEDELKGALRETLGSEPPKCGWMQCDIENCGDA